MKERLLTFQDYRVKDREPLQDHCGILGAIGPQQFMFLTSGIEGLKKLETRGHDAAGVVGLNEDGAITLKHSKPGRVLEVFSEDFMRKHKQTLADQWVLQTRYGTNGDLLNKPELSTQPCIRMHEETGLPIVVAHNGEFWTDDDDRNGVVSDSIRFAERLSQSTGDDWPSRIIKTLEQERGTYSLIIHVPGEMIVVRDPQAPRPLCYGQYWDELAGDRVWVAGSETIALNKIGVSRVEEVMAGELVRFLPDQQPIVIKNALAPETPKVCLFEDVYIGHGNSKSHIPRNHAGEINDSSQVGENRQRSGEITQREAPLTKDDVDFIVGIPGTAIAGGKGLAREAKLPYIQVVKDRDPHDNERTFMTPDINSIYGKVLNGLRFDREALKGAHVGVVEDSVVRFNVLRAIIDFLKEECGVASIHARILCPPVIDACTRGGANTRSRDELFAGRILLASEGELSDDELVELMRKEMGIESLAFLSLEGLKESQTGNPHDERFCTECLLDSKSPSGTIFLGENIPVISR